MLSGCMARTVVTRNDDPNHLAQNEAIKNQVLHIAKTGDWLVVRGYHLADNLVSNATGIPISHVGVVNMRALTVVEAEGQGIHLSSVDEFIDKSFRLLIIRPRWRTEANADTAWRNAEKLVGNSYDFLGTIGFNYPQKYYCSELAIEIYKDWYSGKEKFPQVIKPGELYLYGDVLYDSLPRDEM
ncbi:hypothetical protein BTA51_09895 [Hahella sp. CCB-MM4]|nr:hypothetical protein BTA51_09895 [Hahella sp. CCB-MM4]